MSTKAVFDFDLDSKPITWRYDKATTLKQIIQNREAYYNSKIKPFLTGFNADLMDLSTASELGIAIWAKILNFPVSIISEEDSDLFFGFGADRQNFNSESNFWGLEPSVPPLFLEEARIILKLRYWRLVSPCVPYIDNAFFDAAFGGDLKCIDNKNMTVAYLWREPTFSDKLAQILIKNDLLPRAAGVELELLEAGNTFGFGVDRLNFGNGNFAIAGEL
jgi:hypothetical protein